VFLSGATIPSYNKSGTDFSIGVYDESKTNQEQWMAAIVDNGGNTVRINLHYDGLWWLQYDPGSQNTSGDTLSLIVELKEFLNTAEKYNIFCNNHYMKR